MDLFGLKIPATIALALAAALGYLLGRGTRSGRGKASSHDQGDPSRTLKEALAARLALLHRYGTPFSLAVLEVDRAAAGGDAHGRGQGDRLNELVAALVSDSARQTDLIVRLDKGQLAVLMPQAGLEEVAIFAERTRARAEAELGVALSGGVAAVLDGDTPNSILARAMDALGAARWAGGNAIYRHNGHEAESIWEEVLAEPTSP